MKTFNFSLNSLCSQCLKYTFCVLTKFVVIDDGGSSMNSLHMCKSWCRRGWINALFISESWCLACSLYGFWKEFNLLKTTAIWFSILEDWPECKWIWHTLTIKSHFITKHTCRILRTVLGLSIFAQMDISCEAEFWHCYFGLQAPYPSKDLIFFIKGA